LNNEIIEKHINKNNLQKLKNRMKFEREKLEDEI
jgi:hypothetical protein